MIRTFRNTTAAVHQHSFHRNALSTCHSVSLKNLICQSSLPRLRHSAAQWLRRLLVKTEKKMKKIPDGLFKKLIICSCRVW